jgi:hypothetical protein
MSKASSNLQNNGDDLAASKQGALTIAGKFAGLFSRPLAFDAMNRRCGSNPLSSA